MTHPNASTALARVVVDELACAGLRYLAISPGSRSGALAIAAAEHPDLTTSVMIDERSAAFWALGAARASRRPAGVVATSGTAPANFFPAIVEADMSGVPLVAISADRPLEMRGVGANQTIDQVELFGSKVRAFRGIEAPETSADLNSEWRGDVRELIQAALGEPMPGPVHLNVAFREPTVPVADDGRSAGEPYRFPTPRIDPPAPPARPAQSGLFDLVIGADRGLVIAGDGEYDRDALTVRAAALGWPILATALSGLRGREVVSAYRFLLAEDIPERLRPDTVVAVGAIGPDPILEDLAACATTRVRVDRWGRHIDPARNATHVVRADPLEVLGHVEGRASDSWEKGWLLADVEVRRKVVESVEGRPQMSGGGVAHALNRIDRGALVVASSLPVREVDSHLTTAGPVFANRGASGIDGFVSSASGVASVIPRTLAVAGDLSLLHDVNGFLSDARIDLTLIVIDNEGGGLFDSIPQARHAPGFERLFITPPNRDLAALLKGHGAHVVVTTDPESLIEAVGAALDRPGLDCVIVPVDRRYDLEVRTESYS